MSDEKRFPSSYFIHAFHPRPDEESIMRYLQLEGESK